MQYIKLMHSFDNLVEVIPFSYIIEQLEGKYTEWPNPQITENHACDRQSGLNDSAPRKQILVV